MHKKNIMLNSRDIIHWFNAIRNLPEEQRFRALEGLWETQINSKAWIIEELNVLLSNNNSSHNIYVFGGWIGILSSMLFQCSKFKINRIRSIDLDPWCENIADTVCKPYEMDGWRFKARTHNMSSYQYEYQLEPHIVINTSTEHVTQYVYDDWYDRIPKNTLVVIQGNNFYSCDQHVRCAENIEQFMNINRVENPLYSDVLSNSQYDRYMTIWRKQCS